MIGNMPRKLPPFVSRERTRHGKIKFYFRRGKGPRTRLPDDTQSSEFTAAYEHALTDTPVPIRSTPKTPSDTLSWLVERYMEGAKWAGFSYSTRRQRELIFLEAIKRSGDVSYLAITSKTIQSAVDDRAETPAQANNFLKAMRGLFQWAFRNDYVQTNPCIGIERVRYQTVGFKPWTTEDVKEFCSKWPTGTTERLALELFLVVGLRRGDMHRAGRQHLRGTTFHMKTAKTGSEITVEFPESLMHTIASTKTGDLHFLVKDNNEPFSSKESFGNWFSKAARSAGIEKSAHGLRKLAATLVANEGGSAHELMAHFGWSNIKEAENYTKGADRKRLGLTSSRRAADLIGNITARTLSLGAGKTSDMEKKSKG